VTLAAYPLWVVQRAAEHAPGWVRRLLLDGPGIVVAPVEVEPPVLTEFEAWLLARWLRDIRSDEFRGSVQRERLMAEWERGGQ
jgi:uncharacterized heparinase superfamily protein